MIILIIFSSSYCNDICKELDILSMNIISLIESNNWDEAYSQSMTLSDKWHCYSKFFSLFTNDTELDIINDDIIHCSQYIKNNDIIESTASLHVIIHRFKHIEDFQKLTFENLL